MKSNVEFARRVFFWAGIYGVLVIAPQYFLEQRVGQEYPPAITHPEYFYGFVGVGLAWQIAFLLMSRDPIGMRPVMLAVFAAIDLLLGVLFFICYLRCGKTDPETSGAR